MKKRKDERYQIQVDIGTDENGKRVRKTVYGKSPKEAKKNADILRLAFGRGISDISTPLNQWIDMFLAVEKRRITLPEYNTKSYRLKRFERFAGAKTIPYSIKPFTVNQFLILLADEKKAEKTIREYKNTISQFFRFAKQNGGISDNPCESISIPLAEKKHNRRALSAAEQKRIANLPDELYPGKAMALICMWAGLRRGEAAALLWEDINFKDKTIRVNKSYNFKEQKIKAPKTEAGIRYVPLLPCLEDYLNTIPKSSPYVFGKLMQEWDWDKELSHILKYLDKEYGNPDVIPKRISSKYVVVVTIDAFTWHELRHTYCTILYDNDIPLKVAMKWMGHKSAKMTEEIYTHLSAEKEDTAKQAILSYGSQMVVNT